MSAEGRGERHTATLGVLGGGQLGRMMALSGAPLGVRFRFLDPDPQAPAGDVGELIVGRFDDQSVLERFAAGTDALTYEFENVPSSTARWLAERRTGLVFPPAGALEVAQDRLQEKLAFARAGLEVPAFCAVSSVQELTAAIAGPIGVPCVLKTRRMGYDGKGQSVIERAEQAEGAFALVAGHLNGSAPVATELIVERFVRFEREVSIVCVRSADGQTRHYPITQNTHSGGILRTSVAGAEQIPEAVERRARAMVERLLEDMRYVGVLALELFVVCDDSVEGGVRLLGNEMAPRVHNSGHWTMDGSHTGQFENHVRAVLGWPVGDTGTRSVEGPGTLWGMVNLIGGPMPDLKSLACEPWMHVHVYSKSARAGRKIGHVNVCASGRTELGARMERVRAMLPSARIGASAG